MVTRHAAAYSISAGLLLCSGAVHAREPHLNLALYGCDSIKPRELERLLALELAAAETQLGQQSASVSFECRAKTFSVSVASQAASGSNHNRSFPSRSHKPSARTLALAASQLLLEIFASTAGTSPPEIQQNQAAEPASKEQTNPKQALPQPKTTTIANKHATAGVQASGATNTQNASLTAEQGRSAWSIGVQVGAHLRSLNAPVLLASATLQLRLAVGEQWGLGCLVNAEYGQFRALPGSVEVQTLAQLMEFWWRSSRVHTWALVAGVAVGGRYVRARGISQHPDYVGLNQMAYIADGFLEIGPELRLPGLGLGLGVQVGYSLPEWVGHIPQHSDLNGGGLWLGSLLQAQF